MKWLDVPRDPLCDDDTLETLYELTQSVASASISILTNPNPTMNLPVIKKTPALATGTSSQLDKTA